MVFLTDIDSPNRFVDLDFNQEQATVLQRLISKPNFPHLCIYGPAGSGKATRVRALLHELFGSSTSETQAESLEIQLASKCINQAYHASQHHIELSPSDVGHYDRVVVQEMIKEMAATSNATDQRFKVIVIKQADLLSHEAQQALRRTIEKYDSSCRVILVATNFSKIIPALRSRFFHVRNPAPANANITTILNKIIQLKKINPIPPVTVIDHIVDKCEHNLHRAVNYLQIYLSKVSKQQLPPTSTSFEYDWIEKIDALARKVTNTQATIKEIQELLNQALSFMVPVHDILRLLVPKLLDCCPDNETQHKLLTCASECDHSLVVSSMPNIALELFLVQFLIIHRTALEEAVRGLELIDFSI